jgi:hypothetical protein
MYAVNHYRDNPLSYLLEYTFGVHKHTVNCWEDPSKHIHNQLTHGHFIMLG